MSQRKEQPKMKLTRPRKIAIVIVITAIIAPAALAILGLGDIVFDPTNFGKLVEQLAQMQQQYTQLVQTYQVVTAQYNQMIWMAKMIPANLRVRYRTLVTPWRNSTATNTYGTTGGWIAAINTGNDVAGGYQRAIQQLNAYGAALGNIPADQLDRVKTSYATVIGLPNRQEARNLLLTVPLRRAKGRRPPLVEPKSVSHRMLRNIGILKIPYFSGAFGIRFSRLLDVAVESLKAQGCDRLIIDLRGCLGGSLGFARLLSYLCPERIPIGYDVTRKRLQRGYNVAQFPRVPMPSTKLGVLFCLARFSVRDKSLMLLTQGLGKQPFHGRIAVLSERVDQQRRGNGCSVCEGHETCNGRGQTDERQCPWGDDV